MFEELKERLKSRGTQWVELCVTKPDGCKFHLIMEKGAYEKLPKSKLQKIKNIIN